MSSNVLGVDAHMYNTIIKENIIVFNVLDTYVNKVINHTQISEALLPNITAHADLGDAPIH